MKRAPPAGQRSTADAIALRARMRKPQDNALRYMPNERTRMQRLRRLLTLLAVLLCQPALANDAALWTGLRSGALVALIRHAEAPGTGDPAGFKLGDCTTQRNLSEQGRRQAQDAGAMLRDKGITAATVYSSQWCRCLDTAADLGLGPVVQQPALNSFFDDVKRDAEQTEALRRLIRERPPGKPLIMVTHQVNITALSGVYPRSGEIIVVRPDGGQITVIGRVATLK